MPLLNLLLPAIKLLAKPVANWASKQQEISQQKHAAKLELTRTRVNKIGSFGINLLLIIFTYPLVILCILFTVYICGGIDDFQTPANELVAAINNLTDNQYKVILLTIVTTAFGKGIWDSRQVAKQMNGSHSAAVQGRSASKPKPPKADNLNNRK